MRRSAFCLALFTCPIYGANETSPKAPIGLYARFEHPLPGGVNNILQRELRSIFSPIGMRFEWRPMADSGQEVWAALAVLNFKGQCDSRKISPVVSFTAGALGWTHVSDGKVLPFTDIDCDRIGAFVESQLVSLPIEYRERIFQRAIARVVAHELFHVFTQTTGHGSEGAGKAEFSVQDLVSDYFQFRSRDVRALRLSSSASR